jgi:hypothetical protein
MTGLSRTSGNGTFLPCYFLSDRRAAKFLRRRESKSALVWQARVRSSRPSASNGAWGVATQPETGSQDNLTGGLGSPRIRVADLRTQTAVKASDSLRTKSDSANGHPRALARCTRLN